jgi:hypothetical protein
MTEGMTPPELVAAGEAVFGPRWIRPLARTIGWNHRSVRFWKTGERPIPQAAAAKIRSLYRIGPVGVIIRRVVRTVAPDVSPWSAHRVAVTALAELAKAGLLDERVKHE